jgi:hypothetical protein
VLKEHRDAASDLQKTGQFKHWRVQVSGNDAIELSKVFGDRRIFCYLIRRDDGTYDLQPTDYEYKPKISFFNFRRPERRITRNQMFIASVFKLIRDANMWDVIANRHTYLEVNDNNDHIGDRKTEIAHRLKALILDAKLVKTKEHKTLGKKHGPHQVRRRAA